MFCFFSLGKECNSKISKYRSHFVARSLEITNKTVKTTGMYTDLYTRKAELCVCMVRPNIELHSVFDFTIQYMQVKSEIIYRHYQF